ncbi:hypothetical protein GN956_G5176 [Arapaima gigas]
MCVARPVLCIFVVTLLLRGITYSRCKCNYPEILSAYKELILTELQNLNLTGSYTTSNEKDRCPGKVQHILRSIYGMTQTFKCQNTRHLQQEVGKTVEKMEQLIRANCRHVNLGKRDASCKIAKSPKSRRRKKKKLIESLILCWQKLQAVYVPKPKRRV